MSLDVQDLELEIETNTEEEKPIHTLLSETIRMVMRVYFDHLEGQPPHDLYSLFIREVEKPMLEEVMIMAAGNQSVAARWLGLSRTTLKKKLSDYLVQYDAY